MTAAAYGGEYRQQTNDHGVLIRETRESVARLEEGMKAIKDQLSRLEHVPAELARVSSVQANCPARNRRWSSLLGVAMACLSIVLSALSMSYAYGVSAGKDGKPPVFEFGAFDKR